MTTQMKKEQYATCEECERMCYTGGEHAEGEEYYCADCGVEVECESEEEEFNVDDRDAPNILPYKECSVCFERKSCGNYRENDWFCENCAEEAENAEVFERSVFAFVQANFSREKLFPETKPIAISDSISGEVSRELETLQAQNSKLVAENQRLQQQIIQLVLKSLLPSN